MTTPPTAPLLRLRLPGKRRGARPVLGPVALDLHPGTLTALLGPSGGGKTTLLRVLAGLDPEHPPGPGGAVETAPGLRIAPVFQEPTLLPWRRVADNLALVLPRGADPAAAGRALEAVGLAEAADLWPRQLSLGMARRVAIARALAVSPGLLLLDEPFASLDAQAAARLRGVVADLRRDRPDLAVVLVTHDPSDAAALADRALLLGGAPAVVVADLVPPARGPGGGAALAAALEAAAAGYFCAAR